MVLAIGAGVLGAFEGPTPRIPEHLLLSWMSVSRLASTAVFWLSVSAGKDSDGPGDPSYAEARSVGHEANETHNFQFRKSLLRTALNFLMCQLGSRQFC